MQNKLDDTELKYILNTANAVYDYIEQDKIMNQIRFFFTPQFQFYKLISIIKNETSSSNTYHNAVEIYNSLPKKYTVEEIINAHELENKLRYENKSRQELNAYGYVTPETQEEMRILGYKINTNFDVFHKMEMTMNELRPKVLIGVPTEKKTDSYPCIENLMLPPGLLFNYHCPYGMTIDNAYDEIIRTAMWDGADYLFTVEDDTFPTDPDVFQKLLNIIQANGEKTIAGAWYPRRHSIRQGAPMESHNGEAPVSMSDDGTIREASIMPMGCTLFPMKVFSDVKRPWFLTTKSISQDAGFSYKAIKAGWKLLVDTSLKCKHIDRITGIVYE